MLVDMQKPWVFDDSLVFTIRDKILRYRGQRVPAIVPEDWGFSRMARAVGAKLWATREVALDHYGMMKYPNTQIWGTSKTDMAPPATDPIVDAAVRASTKVDGYMQEVELRWLAEMAKKSTAIVEVGSWKGRSTKALAAATSGVVYAVDNWKGSAGGDLTELEANEKGSEAIFAEFKANLAPEIAAGKVVIVNADHATAMDEVRERLGGNVADMVFIDGEHNYEAVKRDILNYSEILKPGGLLCGHDCCEAHPGVVKALRELAPVAEVHAGSVWSCRAALAEGAAV
jgi:predicted O-methyltransferase YrrM